MELRTKKQVGFSAAYLLITIAFYALLALLLRDTIDVILFFLVLASAFLWIIVQTISFALLGDERWFGIMLVATPPLIMIIAGLASVPALVGAVLLAVFLGIAWRSIQYEMRSRIKFNTRVVFDAGMRSIILGLVVAVVALTLPAIRSQVERGQLGVPQRYVAAVMNPITPLLRNYLPGYTPQASVDELIRSYTLDQIGGSGADIEIGGAQLAGIKDNLSQRFGIRVRGDETVPQLISRKIDGYLRDLAQGGGLVATLVIMAIVLLALRAVIPVFVWPALVIIAAFIAVARRINLIYLLTETVEAERLYL